MDKTIFEKQGGTYRRQGDYVLPNLAVPEGTSIGAWGRRRLRYLKEHRKGIYTGLQLSGKLDDHLADIDRQAREQMDTMIQQIARTPGITEELKTKDQTVWVGAMNNIRASPLPLPSTQGDPGAGHPLCRHPGCTQCRGGEGHG